MTKSNRYNATIQAIEKWVLRFLQFTDNTYSLPIALWTIATYIYPDFDSFPYMVITSATKRSGKTRLGEIISFMCSNPSFAGSMSAAALYAELETSKPTIFIDEAEKLNSESASVMRSVLNVGYRKGSKVKRVIGNQIKEYDTFCPKVFILIGDVYDTLRDRSIIVRMKRAEAGAVERFMFEQQKAEGEELRDKISEMLEETRYEIAGKFSEFAGLDFLGDRDAEIWTPLFCIAQVLCPERVEELKRIAVDMATEKTAEAEKYIKLLSAEEEAKGNEYDLRLLQDLAVVINGNKHIATADAIPALHALATSPWRKFHGVGLTPHNLSDILERFGVRPAQVKAGPKKNGSKYPSNVRGYRLEDVKKALAKHFGK